MIEYKKHVLDNGLTLLIHQDKKTPNVAFNLLYDVGSKDENPNKTGFAHLFEHLMFGGSKNIPSFDTPLQLVGGENNAFTSTDITNYYIQVPKNNIETAFWLESDRLNELAFSEKSLEVQRKVVIEEFKQRYLNQPYGDIWLILRPLVYQFHSYAWPTIGKKIEHIEDATMKDVKDFFYQHYCPNRAFLTVAGDVNESEIIDLSTKWFGDINRNSDYKRNLKSEPLQTEEKTEKVYRKVPANLIVKVFRMPNRKDKNYYTADLISDLLGRGNSSYLYQKLVKEKSILNDVNVYITGEVEEGLLVISAKLKDNIYEDDANKIIQETLQNFLILNEEKIAAKLQGVKNKVESTLVMNDIHILNRAMNLSYFEMLGDANDANNEINYYLQVEAKALMEFAKNLLSPKNSTTLFYLKEK
jgi:zinc protease